MPQSIVETLTPQILTGYARGAFELMEEQDTSLARWLPNIPVNDLSIQYAVGGGSLDDLAQWRAFGAEPSLGVRKGMSYRRAELQPISEVVPLGEREIIRSYSKEGVLDAECKKIAITIARRIFNSVEKVRATVIETGKASVTVGGGTTVDDYGRDAGMAVAASTAWSNSAAKPLSDLIAWVDTYVQLNGVTPGCIVVSKKTRAYIAQAAEFKTVLAGGGARPGTPDDVDNILAAYDLPPLVTYDRRYAGGRFLPVDKLFLLPSPSAPVLAAGQESPELLGATYFGPTAASHAPGWSLAEGEQAGIYSALHVAEKPGDMYKVYADCMAWPVMANPNLSMACSNVG